jgi:hypothetical protein
MSDMDKTVKTGKYSEDEQIGISYNNLTKTQEQALELINKNAQLEAEKGKTLEQLKIIKRLQERLEHEQAKVAELVKKSVQNEAGMKALAELEAKARRVDELESKLEKMAGLEIKARKMVELETRVQKVDVLEAKVKKLSDAISKISGIAASGKED